MINLFWVKHLFNKKLLNSSEKNVSFLNLNIKEKTHENEKIIVQTSVSITQMTTKICYA